MTDTLKPCPFPPPQGLTEEQHADPKRMLVVHRDRYVSPGPAWLVQCRCGVKGPERHTKAEAIAAWNTRAPGPIDFSGVELDVIEAAVEWSLMREASRFGPINMAKVHADLATAVSELLNEGEGEWRREWAENRPAERVPEEVVEVYRFHKAYAAGSVEHRSCAAAISGVVHTIYGPEGVKQLEGE